MIHYFEDKGTKNVVGYNELVNYFKLEEPFIKSDYKDLIALILLLKNLAIYSLIERGKFLLKQAYAYKAFPTNLKEFNAVEYSDRLRQYRVYFYPDFDHFIEFGE